MKEITSKKTKKIQIITDETWDRIVAKGWKKRFIMIDMPEKKLKEVPIITKSEEIKVNVPEEILTKPIIKNLKKSR